MRFVGGYQMWSVVGVGTLRSFSITGPFAEVAGWLDRESDLIIVIGIIILLISC